MISKLCLATGARWGEVESRNMTHLQNSCIVYSQTKGKKVRSIPINQNLYREVEAHFEQYGEFTSSLCSFDRAFKRSNIRLPRGQSSHVLRHRFASHFMMKGGNIIVLQRILGHADISMTMRYAKFDPNHFQEAISLNPLSDLENDTKEVFQEAKELFS